MNIAGIVAEYNPFHSGHEYHLAKTRELLGDDCAFVCVMGDKELNWDSIAKLFKKHGKKPKTPTVGGDAQ